MNRILNWNRQLCALLSAFALLSVSADAETCNPNQQLVCRLADSSYVSTLNNIYSTSTKSYLPEIGAFLLCAAPDLDMDSLADVVSGSPMVMYCHPNYELDDPESVQGSQPFVDRPGNSTTYEEQANAQNLSLGSLESIPDPGTVRVAVIDAGVDITHPQLGSVVTSGFDYIDNDLLANDEPGGSATGHGTYIAGLIALVAPQAEIVSYRVLDTSGHGDGFTVAQAILQAVADSCKVINLSMVMSEQHVTVTEAIAFAHNHNVVVVASAGNDSLGTVQYPAKDQWAVGVAAVDTSNHKTDFSNYGSSIDVCAPGLSLYSTFYDTAFATWSGTSFAAPFVSAQAVWLYSLKPSATWSEVVNAIKQSATNIDILNPSCAGKLGSGVINIRSSFDELVTCGDIDLQNDDATISDLTLLIDHLFITFGPLPSNALANVDGIGGIDISDLSVLIDHMFVSFAPIDCGL